MANPAYEASLYACDTRVGLRVQEFIELLVCILVENPYLQKFFK
jgi:hypothetical protein